MIRYWRTPERRLSHRKQWELKETAENEPEKTYSSSVVLELINEIEALDQLQNVRQYYDWLKNKQHQEQVTELQEFIDILDNKIKTLEYTRMLYKSQ